MSIDPPVGLRIVSDATGTWQPEKPTYLKSYLPSGNRGDGMIEFTDNPRQAMSFTSARGAMALWSAQSKLRPYGDDGKPNKPLTAYTVEVISLKRK